MSTFKRVRVAPPPHDPLADSEEEEEEEEDEDDDEDDSDAMVDDNDSEDEDSLDRAPMVYVVNGAHQEGPIFTIIAPHSNVAVADAYAFVELIRACQQTLLISPDVGNLDEVVSVLQKSLRIYAEEGDEGSIIFTKPPHDVNYLYEALKTSVKEGLHEREEYEDEIRRFAKSWGL